MSKCLVCEKPAIEDNDLRAMVMVCEEHYKILKKGETESDKYFRVRSRVGKLST